MRLFGPLSNPMNPSKWGFPEGLKVHVNNRKLSITRTCSACKKGQFDVAKLMANNQFKAFSINLNARHQNGMTSDYEWLVIIHLRLLGTLEEAITNEWPWSVLCPNKGNNCNTVSDCATYLDIVLPNLRAILGGKVAGNAAKVPKLFKQASQVHSKT